MVEEKGGCAQWGEMGYVIGGGGSGVRLGEELASVLRARRCLVASEMTGLWSYVLLICFLCLWHLASEGLWL